MIERLLGKSWIDRMTTGDRIGRTQFAYRPLVGARGALALLVLSWLRELGRCKKIGVFLSDVSGAFDRVSTEAAR